MAFGIASPPKSLRTLLGMNFLVFSKIRTPTEGFATCGTLVRLLACVDSLVMDQGCDLAKCFPAFSTLVGFFSRVNPLVVNEG